MLLMHNMYTTILNDLLCNKYDCIHYYYRLDQEGLIPTTCMTGVLTSFASAVRSLSECGGTLAPAGTNQAMCNICGFFLYITL